MLATPKGRGGPGAGLLVTASAGKLLLLLPLALAAFALALQVMDGGAVFWGLAAECQARRGGGLLVFSCTRDVGQRSRAGVPHTPPADPASNAEPTLVPCAVVSTAGCVGCCAGREGGGGGQARV